MEEFYTQNGWKGDKFDNKLSLKEIAKIVRGILKKEFPLCKFSVRTEYYSMGKSLHLSLISGPFDPFVNEFPPEHFHPESWLKENQLNNLKSCRDNGHSQLNQYYLDTDHTLTARAREILQRAYNTVKDYNYNDSDGMIDYFDTNFYLNLEIGKWDRPYKNTTEA